MSDIGFRDAKFKSCHKRTKEDAAMTHWDTHVSLIHNEEEQPMAMKKSNPWQFNLG